MRGIGHSVAKPCTAVHRPEDGCGRDGARRRALAARSAFASGPAAARFRPRAHPNALFTAARATRRLFVAAPQVSPIPRASALRPLLSYALLVGFPLAALLAILRAGSRLQAPPSVGGTWRSEARQDTLLLEVEQSGVHLVVRADTFRFTGVLRGDSILAAAKTRPPADADAPCGPRRGMGLRARVDRAAEPDRMRGTLLVPGDPHCRPAGFTAVREPAGRGRGRR
jgi:hypothetical protein